MTIINERIIHHLVIYSKPNQKADLRPKIVNKSPRPPELGPGGDKFRPLAMTTTHASQSPACDCDFSARPLTAEFITTPTECPVK